MVALCLIALCVGRPSEIVAQEPTEVLSIWPSTPPGDEGIELGAEVDTTDEDGRLVGGRRVIRLGNVSNPQIAVYPAPKEIATGAAVVICPGGGHYILAYDLEGTEVAEWLNSIGITAVLLKYRVPARNREKRWEAAVQDAQRAMGIVRSRAAEWELDPNRIGILGFSAGGETAGLTALFENDRTYEAIDEFDQANCRPDFAILIYAAGFYDPETKALRSHINVSASTPPMFFAHAADDRVPVQNCLLLYNALHEAGVSGDLHVYESGGHGYGLRRTDQPVTQWPDRCHEWLQSAGLLTVSERSSD